MKLFVVKMDMTDGTTQWYDHGVYFGTKQIHRAKFYSARQYADLRAEQITEIQSSWISTIKGVAVVAVEVNVNVKEIK
jgi:hypothetical protein